MISVKINVKNFPALEQYCSSGCAAFFQYFQSEAGYIPPKFRQLRETNHYYLLLWLTVLKGFLHIAGRRYCFAPNASKSIPICFLRTGLNQKFFVFNVRRLANDRAQIPCKTGQASVLHAKH